MKRHRSFAIVGVIAAAVSSTAAAGPYADSVFNYAPGALTESAVAPGQFFNDPAQALGAPDPAATRLVPSAQVVQLGQGGSITLGFGQPIVNKAPGAVPANPLGYDFTVFGNAFEQGFEGSGLFFREPGFVEVAQKVGGTPGTFYLLLPDKRPSQLIGGDGVRADADTGPGTTLVTGYADVHATIGSGNPLLAPDQAGSAGGDGFFLERAVLESAPGVPLLDGNGNPQFVNLASVDFVRITDALPGDAGPTGGYTTDVDAVVGLPAAPEPGTVGVVTVVVAAALVRRRRRA